MGQWKFAKHIVAEAAQQPPKSKCKYLCLFMVSQKKNYLFFHISTTRFLISAAYLPARRCNLCKNEQLNEEAEFFISVRAHHNIGSASN